MESGILELKIVEEEKLNNNNNNIYIIYMYIYN